MIKTIDYYFSVASPWAYLGSARFMRLVEEHVAHVNVIPLDLTRVMAATGGTSFDKRSPQRRNYRQIELARWIRRLNVPLTLTPQYYPVDRQPASCLIIAARDRADTRHILNLVHAVLRAIWAEERNIADWETLAELARTAGFDGRALVDAAQRPETITAYEDETNRAIAEGVFGAPSYVIDGELFWGQDRLDFVDEALRNRNG